MANPINDRSIEDISEQDEQIEQYEKCTSTSYPYAQP